MITIVPRAVLLGLFISFATVPVCLAAGCDDAPTQRALNECAAASLKKTDTALNTAYQQIMQRLADDADTKRLLTAVQRAWVGFRDAECAFAAAKVSGGSIYGMIVTSCKDALTNERLKQLETFLHCEKGDLSCPVSAN